MKKLVTKRLILSLVSVILLGCASENQEWGTEKIEVEEIPITINPEKVTGKLDVYNSMARAVKYNVDFASQNVKKKLELPKDIKTVTAKELINRMVDVKTADENPLYNAIRVLDFSVMYAVNALEDSEALKNEHIYARSSQYLALGAISTHQKTIFAMKKLREIERLVKKEQKEVMLLNDKMERSGGLSQNEIEYKKGLDVAIYELNDFAKALQADQNQYEQLIKFTDKKLALEGRRFYELDDFDKNFVLDAFQKVAVANRTEFKKGNISQENYSFEGIKENIFKDYPEVERLEINGFEAKDALYVEGLIKRANQTAEKLVAAALFYQKSKLTQSPEVEQARKEVLRQLGVAVFEQVEMAYNMVKSASFDYEIIAEKVKSLKQEVREKEKRYSNNYTDKLEVLNLKLKLLQAEAQESQVLAERAVALRSLYFYAGFSPFNQNLMKKELKDIAIALRAAFNQDLVKMLVNSPKSEPKPVVVDTEWNKQENWLETVVEGSKNQSSAAPAKRNVPAAGSSVIDSLNLYVGEEYNQKKIMQLGSFTQCDSVDIEWKKLQKMYPDLQKYQPKAEKTVVGTQEYFRLVVESEKGGLRDVCNKLRQGGHGCILR